MLIGTHLARHVKYFSLRMRQKWNSEETNSRYKNLKIEVIIKYRTSKSYKYIITCRFVNAN